MNDIGQSGYVEECRFKISATLQDAIIFQFLTIESKVCGAGTEVKRSYRSAVGSYGGLRPGLTP